MYSVTFPAVSNWEKKVLFYFQKLSWMNEWILALIFCILLVIYTTLSLLVTVFWFFFVKKNDPPSLGRGFWFFFRQKYFWFYVLKKICINIWIFFSEGDGSDPSRSPYLLLWVIIDFKAINREFGMGQFRHPLWKRFTYIHTYKHTYIHDIHTYIHTYIPGTSHVLCIWPVY